MMASNLPSRFTSAASRLVSSILERSAAIAASAPGTCAKASFARFSFRACNTTWWPCLTSSLAAISPKPSAEPVINILAMMLILYRLNSLPKLRFELWFEQPGQRRHNQPCQDAHRGCAMISRRMSNGGRDVRRNEQDKKYSGGGIHRLE